MRPMRFALPIVAVFGLAQAALAQGAPQPAVGACATPDSIAFRGNSRITDDQLRADVGIAPKSRINSQTLNRALRDVYATNQFEAEGLRASCEIVGNKSILIFHVKERRILSDIRLE